MRRWSEPITFHLRAGALVLLVALLLMLPLQWVAAMLIAATVHECCHGIAVRALGGKIYCVSVGIGGAVMEVSPMGGKKELVAVLAGPAGSLFLLLFIHTFPRIALCGAVQGMYNLLPMLPLDGGRALSCLFTLVLPPKKAARCVRFIQTMMHTLFIVVALTAAFHWGVWMIFLFLPTLMPGNAEIKLAKKTLWRYNRNNIDKGERL